MKFEDVLLLIFGTFFIVWLLFALVSLFFKKKVIIEEQTLKNGTKQYEIKENWFMRIPFLWSPVWRTSLEKFCNIEPIFSTKEEALEWLEHEKQIKEKAKQSEDNSRIINKQRVYEGKR